MNYEVDQFIHFRDLIDKQLKRMSKNNSRLFVVDVEPDALWDTYLAAFPTGTNPIFKERKVHDCSCCRQFIKAVGGVVSIDPLKYTVSSIWDVRLNDATYQPVADALKTLVKSKPIRGRFFYRQADVGTTLSRSFSEEQEVVTWDHFHHKLEPCFVLQNKDIQTARGNASSVFGVVQRGFDELTLDAADTVIELIAGNQLYRGTEHLKAVQGFRTLKQKYDSLRVPPRRARMCWLAPPEAAIRNTVIGTLLQDLSEGMLVDQAASKYEAKVAPENYKRPTAIVTKGMIAKAREKVLELGLEGSLHRRFATQADVITRRIQFMRRPQVQEMTAFDEMEAETKDKTPKRAERLSSHQFFTDVVPNASQIEVFLENRHEPRLVSLVAAQDPDSPSLFRWDNGLSWAYNGSVADSMRRKVKAAGGKIDAPIRFSINWFNYDDLDAHVQRFTNGRKDYEIYYGRKYYSWGNLDVDMNAGRGVSRDAVENIVWESLEKAKGKEYRAFVQQYQVREDEDYGFEAEFEFLGDVRKFSYGRKVLGDITVIRFRVTKQGELEIIESLPSSLSSKELWGLPTQKYHDVKLITPSPNFWGESSTGNLHTFLFLDKCVNPEPARGFFNEFLSPTLEEHRKVFETLGSKIRTPSSTEQLSGLGFSHTQSDHVFCRCTTPNGKHVYRINFTGETK